MANNTGHLKYDELVEVLKLSPHTLDEDKVKIAEKCYPLCKVSTCKSFSSIHGSFIEKKLYKDAFEVEEIYVTVLKKYDKETALNMINSYRCSELC